jgi:hypothetical protein
MRRRHRSKIIELLGFIYFKPISTVCGRAMMLAYERLLLAELSRSAGRTFWPACVAGLASFVGDLEQAGKCARLRSGGDFPAVTSLV